MTQSVSFVRKKCLLLVFVGFSHRKKLYINYPGTVGGKGRGAFLVTGSLVLNRW